MRSWTLPLLCSFVLLGCEEKEGSSAGGGSSDEVGGGDGGGSEVKDSDGDGLTDDEEAALGTDPALSDSDEDGLSDSEEGALGTDPLAADSDGDGFSDLDEDDTDPLDPDDKPYQGGWNKGDCRNDIEATGNGVGDIARDFEAVDQFGDTVRLHDFCDRAVLVILSAMWCGPCQAETEDLAKDFVELESRGLMIIQLLGENTRGQEPTDGNLDSWVSDYDVTFPVLSDGGWSISSRYELDGYIPTTSLIGPGMEILEVDGRVTPGEIEAVLPW
jgi:peroxiredoxin